MQLILPERLEGGESLPAPAGARCILDLIFGRLLDSAPAKAGAPSIKTTKPLVGRAAITQLFALIPRIRGAGKRTAHSLVQ